MAKPTLQPTILILGSGPTGLGAAYRLQELGYENFLVLEKNNFVGGLATSFVDDKGFTWDIGGHVVHSHYQYFDQVFAKHVLKKANTLQREAWVWLYNTFVPYPFQYNLHYLPKKIQQECVAELKKIKTKHKPANFLEWINYNFGQGIAKHFMIPQNLKTWGYDLKTINADWVGDRVATVDLARTLKNIANKRDDVSWGPNNVFHFPKKGGTSYIWQQIAKTIAKEKIKLGKQVTKVDYKKKIVTTRDGKTYQYDFLISSLPVTKLLEIAAHPLTTTAKNHLFSSAVHIVGLGLKGKTPTKLKTKCWMYFPEKDIPFFRATVFSNYSKNNVPDYKTQWSLMCEVAQTPHTTFQNSKGVINEVIKGVIKAQLIKNKQQIIHSWSHSEQLGYPTPTISRNKVIDKILKNLLKEKIYSRGRFGAWKYEVSNMDHTFMQGVEAVDHILHQKPEITVWQPNKVNQKK
ncbi:MAG: protoporphyrinogen/coproporphyrinogen oxidase [Patescibacteria group bacterium]